jgi:hypothetical protein
MTRAHRVARRLDRVMVYRRIGSGATALRMLAADEPERARKWLADLSGDTPRDRHVRAASQALAVLAKPGSAVG